MPAEVVARCRAACTRLAGRPTSVVHGNPTNPSNIRMTADRVALIDWDESHADVPDLDLVLPFNAADLDSVAHDIAAQASAAYEATGLLGGRIRPRAEAAATPKWDCRCVYIRRCSTSRTDQLFRLTRGRGRITASKQRKHRSLTLIAFGWFAAAVVPNDLEPCTTG
jgi:hypothetical protein